MDTALSVLRKQYRELVTWGVSSGSRSQWASLMTRQRLGDMEQGHGEGPSEDLLSETGTV